MTDYLHADIQPTSEILVQSWREMGRCGYTYEWGTYWILVRRWDALDWPDSKAVLHSLTDGDRMLGIEIPFAGGV